jgi:3-isopropylmalate dehydratase small subunit
MDKFTTLTGVAAPLPIINIDTDMIIPKQFLKTIKRTGLGKSLFFEMRYGEDGTRNPISCSTSPPTAERADPCAGDNFGCGSSREHAPWALLDFGIRCVISTSFADIFYNNCFKNGILPIKLPQEDVDKLMEDARTRCQRNRHRRPRKPDDQGPRWRRHQVRYRPVPQALPAQRPRRHRPDPGKAASIDTFETQAVAGPPLGLTPCPDWGTYLMQMRHTKAAKSRRCG